MMAPKVWQGNALGLSAVACVLAISAVCKRTIIMHQSRWCTPGADASTEIAQVHSYTVKFVNIRHRTHTKRLAFQYKIL